MLDKIRRAGVAVTGLALSLGLLATPADAVQARPGGVSWASAHGPTSVNSGATPRSYCC